MTRFQGKGWRKIHRKGRLTPVTHHVNKGHEKTKLSPCLGKYFSLGRAQKKSLSAAEIVNKSTSLQDEKSKRSKGILDNFSPSGD